MLKYVKVVVSRWKKERMLVPEEEGEMERKALASALVRKNMLWLLSPIHQVHALQFLIGFCIGSRG